MRGSKDENDGETLAGREKVVDLNLALIVASSPITRVVVARIAERAGLRTYSEAPETAQPSIAGRLPAIALLSGGEDGHDCDRLLEQLAILRRPAGNAHAPLIVFLANSYAQPPQSDMVDIVVAKPVTPDRLQPVIRDLMDRLQT